MHDTTQWGRPAGCYSACRDKCSQSDKPCPHPEKCIDTDPLPPRSFWAALIIAGLAIVASFFAPWGFALPL